MIVPFFSLHIFSLSLLELDTHVSESQSRFGFITKYQYLPYVFNRYKSQSDNQDWSHMVAP